MNKNVKEKIHYVLLFVTIFIVPIVFQSYFINENSEMYHERVDLDHRHCLERADRDSVDARWCDEIKDAAVETFRSSKPVSGNFFPIMVAQVLVFVLLISHKDLRKQVDELKEKLHR